MAVELVKYILPVEDIDIMIAIVYNNILKDSERVNHILNGLFWDLFCMGDLWIPPFKRTLNDKLE